MIRSKNIEQYKTQVKITAHQRQVLVGVMLGDANLYTQNNGRTYQLRISQSDQHRDYVYHLYDIFQDFVRTAPRRVERRSFCNSTPKGRWFFSTLAHHSFQFYGRRFYKNSVKRVPKDISRFLTARGLAYWYMDDGSLKSAQSKGVLLNTHGFTLKEVEHRSQVLHEKFALKAHPRKQSHQYKSQWKTYYQIYISGNSYELLCELIDPFLIPSMRYKFPIPRKQRKR